MHRLSVKTPNSPEWAYIYAAEIGKPIPEYENIIATDAKISLLYAKNVLKGRFTAGEQTIASSACCSFEYAQDVLKGRFALGEDVISRSAQYSFLYSAQILSARFPKGENAIAKSAEYSYSYAKTILKAPFPLGEKAIAASVEHAFNYSSLILKKSFPLGEKVIGSNAFYAFHYAHNILHGPFRAGEWSIAKSSIYSYKYACYVLSEGKKYSVRFIRGEDAVYKDAETAYLYTRDIYRPCTPFYVEMTIAQSAKYSYLYAFNILKGPFREGERAIEKSAEYSYRYAVDVLKRKFFDGEKAISQDAKYSCMYAEAFAGNRLNCSGETSIANSNNIELQARYMKSLFKFPTANVSPHLLRLEDIIAKIAYGYMQYVAGGSSVKKIYEYIVKTSRFEDSIIHNSLCTRVFILLCKATKNEAYLIRHIRKCGFTDNEAENIIADNPQCAYIYARQVLKRRFFTGEKSIAKHPRLALAYAQNVLKGRFPAGEDAIAKSAELSLTYANFLNEPFLKGEVSMRKVDSIWDEYKNAPYYHDLCNVVYDPDHYNDCLLWATHLPKDR